jgi:soluble lytic murein transglycosylase-like protein
MITVQKVIFPGIAAGCLFLVLVVSLIANPTIALAEGSGIRLEQPIVLNAPPQEEKPAAEQAPEPAVETAAQPADPVHAQAETDAGACSLSQSYPDSIRQWCATIEKHAVDNNLDPNLLAAVMLQESGGNPQAYSKSGAVGLLQVMPRDGLAASFMCINGPCFASRPSTQELYDPEYNVSYGANMLAGLVQRHGDVREALRSYGPMNMGYRYADIVLNIMNRYR